MLKKIAQIAVAFASIGNLLSADAAVQEFQYQGRITTISESSVFGKVASGDYFTGTFSYDSTTAPSFGATWWSASYVLNGSGDKITANFPSTNLVNTTITATVIDAPAFPVAQYDSFYLRSASVDIPSLIGGGSRSSISLSFNPTGNTGPFESTGLPESLSLNTLPYSGGSVTLLTGNLPTTGNTYLLTRDQNFPSNTVQCYGCYPGGVASIPLATGNTEYARYLDWLAAGNQPMYQDNLAFQITSLSRLDVAVTAVPEPEAYAMMLAGLMVIGAIARRRRIDKY